MTLKDLLQVLDLMPLAFPTFEMHRDNHGQIILSTGLMFKDGIDQGEETELVPFKPLEDILDL